MTRIIKRQELENNTLLLAELKRSIFIYPTDTIYGIGCDATNNELVEEIRNIKKREQNPFSVIIPSKNTAINNLDLSQEALRWLYKLPGKYTLIAKVKKPFVAPSVSPGRKTQGIRMLDNWFQKAVEQMGVPVVTTSLNLAGKPFMTSPKALSEDIKNKVDFVIDDGVLDGNPSTIVDLTTGIAKITKR